MGRWAVVWPCLLLLACGGKSLSGDGAGRQRTARVYVINFGSHDISGFDADASGALTELAGSPFSTDWGPRAVAAAPDRRHLYVAGFPAIQTYSISAASGALSLVAHGTEDPDADALAVAPSGKFLYVGDCEAEGGDAISTLRVENGVARDKVGSVPASRCVNDIAPTPSGRFLYATSQYGSLGALEGFVVDEDSGRLEPLSGSPFATFLATAVRISPRGDLLYVTDQDALVRTFEVDAQTGALTETRTATKTGANPFSIVMDRSGTRLLVGNWSSNSISSYRLDASLERTPVEVPGSPFPLLQAPHVFDFDATGRFVYANEQGSNALSVFELDETGALSPSASGPIPVGDGPLTAVVVD